VGGVNLSSTGADSCLYVQVTSKPCHDLMKLWETPLWCATRNNLSTSVKLLKTGVKLWTGTHMK